MTIPEGSITPAQFEILQLLWQSHTGLSVAEVWETIRGQRDVSRTTVLNLIDRLEKRHWLTREKVDGVFRYRPTIDRAATETQLAHEFVGEFFDGSPASLVLSLLGSDRISPSELRHLKCLLRDTNLTAPGKKRP